MTLREVKVVVSLIVYGSDESIELYWRLQDQNQSRRRCRWLLCRYVANIKSESSGLRVMRVVMSYLSFPGVGSRQWGPPVRYVSDIYPAFKTSLLSFLFSFPSRRIAPKKIQKSFSLMAKYIMNGIVCCRHWIGKNWRFMRPLVISRLANMTSSSYSATAKSIWRNVNWSRRGLEDRGRKQWIKMSATEWDGDFSGLGSNFGLEKMPGAQIWTHPRVDTMYSSRFPQMSPDLFIICETRRSRTERRRA